MIVFERVKLKNFFSFGEQVVEVPLTKHRFTLIHGDSGSGKSTIVVEAITYALFGKPFRQIKKNEVINTVNGRDCLLDVEFKIGKSQFRVVRGVKPDIFEIYKNGKMVNQNPTVRDYQKYLEDSILKMSYKTWTQIVALGFANHTPFMLLSAGARRQMVDEVLGIEIFQRMYLLAKDRINEKKQELTNIEHS
ncbi:MAG TPA: AAA family ATPase, partial [Coprothermobacter proteolyticus]|nr:AAA family ATPase [Coprothermobacter proteolyticus]